MIRQSSKDTDNSKHLVLGIDPGTEKTAFVLLAKTTGIILGDHVKNQEMRRVLSSLAPQSIAIEMVASYGMPVGKEIFETVRWIGRFEEIAIQLGKNVRMIYRKDVKMYLCNSLRAKDSNIRQALIDKYGAPGTKKNPGATYGISGDVWSALAIADYALNAGTYHVAA